MKLKKQMVFGNIKQRQQNVCHNVPIAALPKLGEGGNALDTKGDYNLVIGSTEDECIIFGSRGKQKPAAKYGWEKYIPRELLTAMLKEIQPDRSTAVRETPRAHSYVIEPNKRKI